MTTTKTVGSASTSAGPALASVAWRWLIAAVILGACVFAPMAARAQGFVVLRFAPGLGSNATAVSLNGGVVVGWASFSGGTDAFRWTSAGGMQDLGAPPGRFGSRAHSTSADGAIVVGSSPGYGDVNRAFVWTSAQGMQSLDPLPGMNYSDCWGISGNGMVMVGESAPVQYQSHAVLWTSQGVTALGALSGDTFSVAAGASADGAVVVGTSWDAAGHYHAFRWTGETGMQSLGLLPGGSYAIARAVSRDGTVVVGEAGVAGGGRAFRWTAATGMQDLGLSAGATNSTAFGVSADGSEVVGSATVSDSHAILWKASLGMVDLNSYLPSRGINLGGVLLNQAQAVGADGLTIVGGPQLGWVATLAGCGSADFNHDGAVNDTDIAAFFACIAGNCCATCGSADFNGDGDTGTDADIEAFFRVLAGGSC